MAPPAPTRQLLRHLRRLAATPETRRTWSSTQTHRWKPCPQLQSVHRPAQTSKSIPSRAILNRPLSTSCAHRNVGDSNAPDLPPTATTLPDITNYYTLFPQTLPLGPPPKGPFSIPLAALKREFLALQAQHHPDKYTGSATAHTKSVALSSLLNTAYKTLSSPLLRARYLLQHNYDIDITSEDNATHRGVTDQETLIEVMDVQERVEEARDQEVIDALKTENRARIAETEDLLARAFENADVDAAKKECIRLNYWTSLQQGLDDWEPGKDVRLIH
ncbi:hypothetical protein B0A52_03358 [Exophiala mesophila]|uniref:Co-chaperone HscB C-terminal oligomerisation domain-containing protein n=1 Tax=Exophiala mesophila TaxID=212818 RepID=A0A438NB56_EXOME|nr:hypothetical protein B0A52_03358 [Exophiala mesophila]